MSHPDKGKGLRSESQQRFVKLTDAAVERVELPAGKSQVYLYDSEQPGLALRVRASGGKSSVYLFTKPGIDGTQRKTLGAWPRFKEKDARAAAKIATGDLVRTGDPNAAKREAKQQQLAAKERKTLGDGIEGVFPAFADFNNRIKHPGGFRLYIAASEREWLTPNGKANFLIYPGLEEDPLGGNGLTLTTIRSHDQYNTTMYGLNDRYRGIKGRRDVIFVNERDLSKRGLSHGDLVDVTVDTPANSDLSERIMRGLTAVSYKIAEGSVAAYYPEANVLIALDHYDAKSGTPSYKSTPEIRASAALAAPSAQTGAIV